MSSVSLSVISVVFLRRRLISLVRKINSRNYIYLLNILQHIIQSQRFKAMLTILKVVSKNTKEWICMNLCTTKANYTTNSQVDAAMDARMVNDKPSNQGVKTADDQCHNTHQESILSNTVTESDIYNNYSYTSCVNWEIEKTPETHSKKLEFNIDKPETDLNW